MKKTILSVALLAATSVYAESRFVSVVMIKEGVNYNIEKPDGSVPPSPEKVNPCIGSTTSFFDYGFKIATDVCSCFPKSSLEANPEMFSIPELPHDVSESNACGCFTEEEFANPTPPLTPYMMTCPVEGDVFEPEVPTDPDDSDDTTDPDQPTTPPDGDGGEGNGELNPSDYVNNVWYNSYVEDYYTKKYFNYYPDYVNSGRTLFEYKLDSDFNSAGTEYEFPPTKAYNASIWISKLPSELPTENVDFSKVTELKDFYSGVDSLFNFQNIKDISSIGIRNGAEFSSQNIDGSVHFNNLGIQAYSGSGNKITLNKADFSGRTLWIKVGSTNSDGMSPYSEPSNFSDLTIVNMPRILEGSIEVYGEISLIDSHPDFCKAIADGDITFSQLKEPIPDHVFMGYLMGGTPEKVQEHFNYIPDTCN